MALSFARSLVAALTAVVAGAAAAACIATAPGGIHRVTDEDAGDGSFVIEDSGSISDAKLDVSQDPHAVVGCEPAHGPFLGGQRVLVHGNGFTSKVRVWFGATEADPASLIPIDPTRVQIAAPPGTAGPVDVTVQNADDASTKRTLAGGYAYDKLYAAPDSGPVAGGSIIEIIGQSTQWDATSVAKIGNVPCTKLVVDSPTSLACTVPKGTPGAKSVSVVTGAETLVVLDAYTYEDSNNGYKGGLSGSPLNGQLKVLIYDNFTGDYVPGALAIAGDDFATAIKGTSDGTGVAVLTDPSLKGPVTVTVAGYCHSPITFVDVKVDTVTVYLDPTLTPACASNGDPPPVGGKPQIQGVVTGELVWPSDQEFQKGVWTNVPKPQGNEVRAAYLFYATSDPAAPFSLPSAAAAVHESSPGDLGYGFSFVVPAGNRALYAIAGLEDDVAQPPKFIAYAFGVVKGIPVVPDDETPNVYVQMDHTLDQALTMSVTPPQPGPKGPDRLRATVAVMLGNDGFAILPGAQKTPFLPTNGDLPFIGVPALDGSLTGASYLSSARAATGQLLTAPLSVVSRVLTTTTSQPVTIDGFIGVPTLTTPAVNSQWDGTHLATQFPVVGPPIDLTVYDVVAGNGLVHWLVAVPKGSNAIQLPDITSVPNGSLPPGPLVVSVYGARVDGFDWDNVRYLNLRPQGMAAYSLDTFATHL